MSRSRPGPSPVDQHARQEESTEPSPEGCAGGGAVQSRLGGVSIQVQALGQRASIERFCSFLQCPCGAGEVIRAIMFEDSLYLECVGECPWTEVHR